MCGRLGGSARRSRGEAPADCARGAQCLEIFLGAKRHRRPTHVGRFAALRYCYTIVPGGRDAPPRGDTHAGRASNGRSEAASASSDPYSKMEFYRIGQRRVEGGKGGGGGAEGQAV